MHAVIKAVVSLCAYWMRCELHSYCILSIVMHIQHISIAMTSQPANESELQLYRVLQRANLLLYYDTFICQDHLEAMTSNNSVKPEKKSMASKPLHVRRLQKALQEWVTNPAMFQSPIVPTFPASSGSGLMPPSSHALLNQLAVAMASRPSPLALSASQTSPVGMRTSPPIASTVTQSCNSNHSTPSPNSGKEQIISSSTLHSQNQLNQYMNQMSRWMEEELHSYTSAHFSHTSVVTVLLRADTVVLIVSSAMMCSEYSQPSSPITLTPVLVESQISRLSEVAEMLVKNLPPMDPKPQLGNNKKRISKELENCIRLKALVVVEKLIINPRLQSNKFRQNIINRNTISLCFDNLIKTTAEFPNQYVMNMPEEDPRRMDEIRKYAAIYGRFDCKRKPEKPLTLHEVSVNEAAAQICKLIPALLSPYDDSDPSACKRSRTESSPNSVHDIKHFSDEDWKRKQNELDVISTQQMQLINEQSELNKHIKRYE
ncbi:unnamed protein product, partial [Medioppia subpectinata]